MVKTFTLSSLVAAIFSGIHAHAKIVSTIVEARHDAAYVAADAVDMFSKRLDKEVIDGKITAASATTYRSQYKKLLECELDHLIDAAAQSNSVQTCYKLIVAAQKDAGAGASNSGAKRGAKNTEPETKSVGLSALPQTLADTLDVLRALRAELPKQTATCYAEFDDLIKVVSVQVEMQRKAALKNAKPAAKEAATA